MNKCHFAKELSAYLDNQLSERFRLKIERHLLDCKTCADELSGLRILSEKMSMWQAPSPNPAFEQKVKDSILLGELERGEEKMKKKTLTIFMPTAALAGVLVFVLVGILIRGGHYEQAKITVAPQIIQPGGKAATNMPPASVSVNKVEMALRQKDASTNQRYFHENAKVRRGETYTNVIVDGELALGRAGIAEYEHMAFNGYGTYPVLGSEDFNTEQYERIYDNDFLKAVDNPLSTFSIDVDTASYANVRRYLNQNQLPPKDAVRIEELVNYFTYDYPQPKENEPFSVTTEVAACPWNNQHKLVLIGLQGKKIETQNLPASNLVFLIDVSGSMQPQNKLPLVKSAFRLLVNQLRAQDKVSIVVYAGSSGLVLDSTPGDKKETILQAIDNLRAGGSTAGSSGIKLAYEIAKKNLIKDGNNRVILATDGDFNVGVSSDGELVRLIEEKRNEGVFLTVLGFGMDNYKDAKMEKLADKGNGNFAYIDNLLEAKKVFVNQLTGTLFTIAKDVKIQVEFNPAKIKAYRLVGYENRMLKKEDFNDDKKDAGEIGAGHSVTALYEIVPPDVKEDSASVDPLQYQKTTVTASDDLFTVKLRYKEPKEDISKLITKALSGKEKEAVVSENLNFASSAAEFGLILRDSQYKGSASYQAVLGRAKANKGQDADGYRADFIKLVEIAQMLDTK